MHGDPAGGVNEVLEVGVARRKVQCSCGHWVYADNDEDLFWAVRQHADDRHRKDNLSDQVLRELIHLKAVDA